MTGIKNVLIFVGFLSAAFGPSCAYARDPSIVVSSCERTLFQKEDDLIYQIAKRIVLLEEESTVETQLALHSIDYFVDVYSRWEIVQHGRVQDLLFEGGFIRDHGIPYAILCELSKKRFLEPRLWVEIQNRAEDRASDGRDRQSSEFEPDPAAIEFIENCIPLI